MTVNGSVELPADEVAIAKWLTQNGPISIGINANALQVSVAAAVQVAWHGNLIFFHGSGCCIGFSFMKLMLSVHLRAWYQSQQSLSWDPLNVKII